MTARVLDLHCHLLPGVDDGAPDLATALAMGRALVDAGFTEVAVSPHYGEGPGGDVPIDRARVVRAEVQTALDAAQIPLQLLPNAEHHVSALLFERIAQGAVVPVGGQGRWLLTELPWAPMPQVETALFRLQVKGFQVLLAHPERYRYVELETLARLVERGVRLQLELGSFVQAYGRRAFRRASALMEQGLAHVLASDLHRAQDAAAYLRTSLAYVSSRYGEKALRRGVCDNPVALVSDADSNAVPAMMES